MFKIECKENEWYCPCCHQKIPNKLLKGKGKGLRNEMPTDPDEINSLFNMFKKKRK